MYFGVDENLLHFTLPTRVSTKMFAYIQGILQDAVGI